MKKFSFSILMFLLAALVVVNITCKKDDDDNDSNQAPTCQITAPTNGQQIEEGQSVTISVDATDSDGTIEEVRFFMDDVGKGAASSFPYNYTINTTGEPVGNHTLKAIAIDNDGEQTSDEISVELTQGSSGSGEPCPGIETISYGGQVYNTVLIGDQCWLKENLNIGEMIPGGDEMQDNGMIEKYCYGTNPANCATYGGLYQWNEMMDYTTTAGAQGICPDGWHIPTDDEWKILEGTVDSQYPVGDPEWNSIGYRRGFEAGKNLKSTYGWNYQGDGTDLYGFGALPGGGRYSGGSYGSVGNTGSWWSSSEYSGSDAWYRRLFHINNGSHRYYYPKIYGFSVRCLKD
jgi:uncharacterized protein (TIGR02145 family)